MRNLYYEIWVDAIVNIKKQPSNKENWKLKSMFLMTMLCAINLITILMWLGHFGIKIYKINIHGLLGTMLNSFASFLINYALPCLLLNYFLIFYKDKYNKIIEKNPIRINKLFLIYMFSTIGIFFIPILIIYLLQ